MARFDYASDQEYVWAYAVARYLSRVFGECGSTWQFGPWDNLCWNIKMLGRIVKAEYPTGHFYRELNAKERHLALWKANQD